MPTFFSVARAALLAAAFAPGAGFLAAGRAAGAFPAGAALLAGGAFLVGGAFLPGGAFLVGGAFLPGGAFLVDGAFAAGVALLAAGRAAAFPAGALLWVFFAPRAFFTPAFFTGGFLFGEGFLGVGRAGLAVRSEGRFLAEVAFFPEEEAFVPARRA